jgi:SAM-dependent methyltransferase
LDPEEYEIMYRVESSHWWYAGMESITRVVLQCWYKPGQGLSILDTGCGTGAAMTSYLADYGKVTGFDLSKIALEYCQRRGAERLACASDIALPFAPDSFDLVTSLDVLYEKAVSSDSAAIGEASRVLRPGGRFLLRLPAYNWLRSGHDEAVHTARRYTTGQVKKLMSQNGFSVEQLSYANTVLFPVALFVRTIERIVPRGSLRSDLDADPGILNNVLGKVLSAEAPLVAQSLLPFGLSVVAVGRKERTPESASGEKL